MPNDNPQPTSHNPQPTSYNVHKADTVLLCVLRLLDETADLELPPQVEQQINDAYSALFAARRNL